MVISPKIVRENSTLTLEQIKLLDYLRDILQELSDLSEAGGFPEISAPLRDAVTEVKARI